MSLVMLLAAGLAVAGVRWQVTVAGAAIGGLATAGPLLPIGAAAGAGLVAAIRRRLSKRRAADEVMADIAVLCDLVALALTGGLGLHQSLQLAAEETGGAVGAEVEAALRRARVDGMAVAMADTGGAGRRLYRVLARAAATGSEVVASTAQLADEINAEVAAAQLERARRAPVLMLFPLTMLILPGFLLLAIAPALVDAFARLEL